MKGMPNIPDFKGLASAGLSGAISFGGAFIINKLFGNFWGIFNQYGVPILLADNVVSVSFQTNSDVTSAPVEKGTFASYNKVNDPYKATVVMSKGGGNPATRGLFQTQIEMLSKSTLLFHIITPEYVYMNCAITGYSTKREASDNARIVVAAIELQEVRTIKAKYQGDDQKNAEDNPSVDNGQQQVKSSDAAFGTNTAGRVQELSRWQ